MKSPRGITHFKPGSISELMMIAFPLIIISLSENIMIFLDRIILSHYSIMALNSTTLASQAVEVLQDGVLVVTGMAELLVAKLYAQNKIKSMGIPTWQMIYLALFTLPFIFILSQFSGGLILPKPYQSEGLAYYQIFLYSVPLAGMIAALAGFFVGQGKAGIILYSSITINLINLFLDFVLIFGIKPIIPELGAKGAAISAIVSLSIQALWLFAIFVSQSNREKFNTHHARFNKLVFKQAIRIGAPVSISHAFEALGWVFIIRVIANTGLENFTIMSIGNTLYLILGFINDGLYRALSTIMSHHIGSDNMMAIRKTLYKGFLFLFGCMFLFSIPIIFAPNLIIRLFNLKGHLSEWSYDIKLSLIFMWVYFLLYGVYWVFASVLTARHRTKFIMVGNTLSIWASTALPIFIVAYYFTLPATWIWPLMCSYVALGSIGIFLYSHFKFRKV